ncbi:hypothetical protein XELAEV_18031242mg [Xenopus laevis]|uniref:Uncharacterized protein n=1 Tax=Xenopus laevis TaxID=8355 RepID=A0A974HFJ9_XENLA|nr:hypothetical protein XELAEV_18031242mg [Xenopus laevis]
MSAGDVLQGLRLALAGQEGERIRRELVALLGSVQSSDVPAAAGEGSRRPQRRARPPDRLSPAVGGRTQRARCASGEAGSHRSQADGREGRAAARRTSGTEDRRQVGRTGALCGAPGGAGAGTAGSAVRRGRSRKAQSPLLCMSGDALPALQGPSGSPAVEAGGATDGQRGEETPLDGEAREEAAAMGPRESTRGVREVPRETHVAGRRAEVQARPMGDSWDTGVRPGARPGRVFSRSSTTPRRRSPRGAAPGRAGVRDTRREWRSRPRDGTRSRSRSLSRCSWDDCRHQRGDRWGRVDASPSRERFISSGCLSPTRNPGRGSGGVDRDASTRESRSRSRQPGRLGDQDADGATAGRSTARLEGALHGPGGECSRGAGGMHDAQGLLSGLRDLLRRWEPRDPLGETGIGHVASGQPAAAAAATVQEGAGELPGTEGAVQPAPGVVPEAAQRGAYVSFAGPLGTHVKKEVREKIWKGEFVEIFSLLPLEESVELKDDDKKDGKKEEEERSKRYRKIPKTFGNWLRAFCTLASIIGEKHPESCSPLFC